MNAKKRPLQSKECYKHSKIKNNLILEHFVLYLKLLNIYFNAFQKNLNQTKILTLLHCSKQSCKEF